MKDFKTAGRNWGGRSTPREPRGDREDNTETHDELHSR